MYSLETHIDNFITSYVKAHGELQVPLQTEYIVEAPSECCVGEILSRDGEFATTVWQPVKQDTPLSFSNVEDSLDIALDEQFKVLFSRYWSDNLNAKSERGKLQILQVWNEDDGKRLQSNLIAHILMKRQLKQEETLFFALTDEEDFTLSILNRTGEVVLEQVGCEPKEVIAPSLSEFLLTLTPWVIE
ncbi:SecY-interacting protein [Alteromonadaceae bacterium M269]|nr:SecY-interacting protein [Alteromonadaceae bacterium M269]